jgi:hypothetical protein
MDHAPQFEEALACREITIRQSLLLVLYMFTGLMLILTLVSALASFPQDPVASPLANSLEFGAVKSATQEEIVK